MFHDMFLCWSKPNQTKLSLVPVQGKKNKTLTKQDPQQNCLKICFRNQDMSVY